MSPQQLTSSILNLTAKSLFDALQFEHLQLRLVGKVATVRHKFTGQLSKMVPPLGLLPVNPAVGRRYTILGRELPLHVCAVDTNRTPADVTDGGDHRRR